MSHCHRRLRVKFWLGVDIKEMPASQVKFSDQAVWWDGRPQPRADQLVGRPFEGRVAGETPAPAWCEREVRRRDLGDQIYSTGEGGLFETQHGRIRLPSPQKESKHPSGFVPTAASLDFLKSEYVDSSLVPKPRYFPI
jgi:hypothetical protein